MTVEILFYKDRRGRWKVRIVSGDTTCRFSLGTYTLYGALTSLAGIVGEMELGNL